MFNSFSFKYKVRALSSSHLVFILMKKNQSCRGLKVFHFDIFEIIPLKLFLFFIDRTPSVKLFKKNNKIKMKVDERKHIFINCMFIKGRRTLGEW